MTAPASAPARWLVRRRPCPDAALDLYCFPHAGGSPGEYVRWADELPGLQIWGVQAPGRGSRADEEPLRDMDELVGSFLDAVVPREPFALFGHSLGGLVAFEVARALQARGGPRPRRVIVSATPPPPYPPRTELLHRLPDDVLLEEVGRRFGGLPPATLRDPWFRSRIAALHRADLAVFENYRHRPGEPLHHPITALAGDDEAERLGLPGWARHTTAGLRTHVLPGGHFYLRDQRAALLRALWTDLTDLTEGDPA